MSWWLTVLLVAWLVTEIAEGIYVQKLRRRHAALKDHVEVLTRRLEEARR